MVKLKAEVHAGRHHKHIKGNRDKHFCGSKLINFQTFYLSVAVAKISSSTCCLELIAVHFLSVIEFFRFLSLPLINRQMLTRNSFSPCRIQFHSVISAHRGGCSLSASIRNRLSRADNNGKLFLLPIPDESQRRRMHILNYAATSN